MPGAMRQTSMESTLANQRTIILVRHCQPVVDEKSPATAWSLSDAGTRRAQDLAESLRDYRPVRVVTSSERKAIETGQSIASRFDIDLVTDELLNEQGRGTVPFLTDRAAFLAFVRDHFRFPDRAILGNEPAATAADRLAAAVNHHAQIGEPPVILVSHGRVLASYLARLSGDDPWRLWETMTMPDAFVIEPGRVVRIGGR